MESGNRLFVTMMVIGAGGVAAGQNLARSTGTEGIGLVRLVTGALLDFVFMPGLLAIGLGGVVVAFGVALLFVRRDPRFLLVVLRNPLLLIGAAGLTLLVGMEDAVFPGAGVLVGIGWAALLLYAGWTQLGLFDPGRYGPLLAMAFVVGSVALPWFANPSMFLPHDGPTGPPTSIWGWILVLPGLAVQLHGFFTNLSR